MLILLSLLLLPLALHAEDSIDDVVVIRGSEIGGPVPLPPVDAAPPAEAVDEPAPEARSGGRRYMEITVSPDWGGANDSRISRSRQPSRIRSNWMGESSGGAVRLSRDRNHWMGERY